jgi:hypothetical protein
MSTDSSPKSSVDDHIHIDMLHELDNKFIIEENNLNTYTDQHFIHKLNEDLEFIRINNGVYESNSPIIMSNENSDNSDDELDIQYHNSNHLDSNHLDSNHKNTNEKNSLKKLTFREVKKSINKYYEVDDKYSNELDILTTFLKGQKNLYIKSRTITQTKLNILMIPSLIGTAIISICAPIIQPYSWSGAFISGLNAVVALFISFVHYLKLESSSELFLFLMNQYDRLESSIEFTNNKIAFFENDKEKKDLVLSKMKEVEKKINEIKETTSIFIPNEVKQIFPIICNVNIFSFIKRIEIYKQNLLVKFKDIKNEILYIKWKWSDKIENKEQKRLDFLLKMKEKIKDEILQYKNAYGCIDELFMREIKQADNTSLLFIWFFTKPMIGFKSLENHALKEYFSTIFATD